MLTVATLALGVGKSNMNKSLFLIQRKHILTGGEIKMSTLNLHTVMGSVIGTRVLEKEW